MRTLSVWIFGLLCTGLTGVHGLDRFPKDFVVAEKNYSKPVTLTCRTDFNGSVVWKFQNEDIEFKQNIDPDGQNLVVTKVDTPMLGEYSCWNGTNKLSSTYLLLEYERDSDSPISCRAKSYDCNFSCSWNLTGYTAMRFGLGNECSDGEKSCNWVTSSDQLQFELSHSLSPYAEESTMLELTAEAIINLSIVRRTTKFYLRDIVQPDSPRIVRFQKVGQNLNVTIEPPSTWSTPHSFFRLEHEFQYMLKDDGKVVNSSSALIPRRISQLRVRSRDSLVLSNWSQWTPWTNVTY